MIPLRCLLEGARLAQHAKHACVAWRARCLELGTQAAQGRIVYQAAYNITCRHQWHAWDSSLFGPRMPKLVLNAQTLHTAMFRYPWPATSHTLEQEHIASPVDVCAADSALLAWALDSVYQVSAAELVRRLALHPDIFCGTQCTDFSMREAQPGAARFLQAS